MVKMIIALASAAMALAQVQTQPPSSLDGRYQGTLSLRRSDGTPGPHIPFFLVLRNTGRIPSCTGSTESFSSLVPCTDLTVENGHVAFTLPFGGGILFNLAVRSEHLTGTVAARAGEPAAPVNTADLSRVGDLVLSDEINPLQWEGPDRSPAILNLRRQIDGGDPHAIDAFWKGIEATGSPLVEPLSKEASLVTFFWRGSHENNVLLMWPLSAAHVDNFFFSHIPGTDIWFKTLKLRNNTRAYYQISPDDPFASRPPASGQHHAQADPLNSKRENADRAIPLAQTRSLLELPGAPQQPWYEKRGAPRFTTVDRLIKSRLVNGERRVQIYLPPNFSPEHARYPSLYLTDGEDPDGLVFASWTLENLIAAGRIPPIVIVRISNPDQETRRRELSCNDAFERFVSDEIVPIVRREFHTSARASQTAIGGYSLGGLNAACTALRHSNTFGLVLSQSGSFWYEPSGKDFAEPDWIAGAFARSAKLPIRFYMDAGTDELDMTGQGGAILIPNRQVRDVLIAKGYDLHYQEFAGGHEYINWRGSFADGLTALFGLKQ